MSDYMILAPIILLFTLGAFIALRSGAGALIVPTRGETEDVGLRLVAGNFSAMMLRVCGWLVILAAAQSLVGFPKLMPW